MRGVLVRNEIVVEHKDKIAGNGGYFKKAKFIRLRFTTITDSPLPLRRYPHRMKTSFLLLLSAFGVFHTSSAQPTKPIPGEYIVQMRGTSIPNLQKELGEALKARGLQSCTMKPDIAEIKTHTWAFVTCKQSEASASTQAAFSAAAVSQALADTRNIAIEAVEENMKGKVAKLPRALWGVDEVDGKRNRRRCQKRSPRGVGVDVYIMDTGCEPSPGGLCTSDIPTEPDCTDLNGHGTHVGGTATGRKYGVAPRARRHCVKVGDKDLAVPYDAVIPGLARVYEHNKQSVER